LELKDLSVGDIAIEKMGAWLLLAGLLLSTFPQELAVVVLIVIRTVL
jgi:hypothetical protein